ncbi:MAG: FAD-dependent monooxygenase [Woeseiaceae bacterium]|jgi:2-octaprenylphenol hydroxylase|nr:FAD-dependent monooxygenase [Woeseiaceae bacterium]
MKRPFDITVVGAGMTGLGLAALLANESRCAVRVIDAGPPPEFDPAADVGLRVSALAPATVELLGRVGAWQRVLDRRASPYERMQVWDAAASPDGPATVCFDASEFAVAQLGFIVENELVRFALYEALQSSQVIFDFEQPIDAIERRRGRWEVRHADAVTDAELIVGADGGRSFVRDAADIDVDLTRYEQVALVTHVTPERDHERTALQRFLPSGPIGMLPLADGRISIVWSTSPAEAEKACAMSDADLGARLTEVSDRVLGSLTVAGPRGTFPLAAAHAENYVEAGLALIGDAAHSVHPLAGQGVNLGFADVTALADVIVEAFDAGEYPADRPVLRRYERARRGANAAMIRLLTGLNSLFAADSTLVGELRRTGMLLFNRSGPIRNKAVDIAFGTSRR